MREIIKTNITPIFDEDWLLSRFHCEKDDLLFETAENLWEQVQKKLTPGFVIKEFPIEAVEEDGIVIDGQKFESKIISLKLKDEKSVFVYIATCGEDDITLYIDSYKDDILEQYVVDSLAHMAYNQSMVEMTLAMEELGIAKHKRLLPGSVIDWSVADVKKIFKIMDGKYQQLKIRVKDSGLIEPIKATSGLIYATNEEFESCAICPRVHCPDRRLPFDAELHEKMVGAM